MPRASHDPDCSLKRHHRMCQNTWTSPLSKYWTNKDTTPHLQFSGLFNSNLCLCTEQYTVYFNHRSLRF
jgi:hypothetical protein